MSHNNSVFQPPIANKLKTKKDHKVWCQLPASSKTLALANAVNQHTVPFICITPDTPSAIQLQHELQGLLDEQLPLCLFPDWETLPYDNFSPHQDIISQRLTGLYQLSRMQSGVLIVPANTLLHRLAPKSYIEQNSLIIAKGDNKNLHQLRQELEQSGYRCVDQVMEHGEFSVRGAILDLFPMGSNTPFRLDFFDDEIDSIRVFDVETQRSSDNVNNIELLPAHEFPTDQAGINRFRAQYRELFGASTDKDSIYYQVSQGILPNGIEYYLPLFFEQTNTLFDYFPEQSQVVIFGDIKPSTEQYWLDINYRYEDRRYDQRRPLLEPNKLFLAQDEIFAQLKQFNRISVEPNEQATKNQHLGFSVEKLTDVSVKHQLKNPFASLHQALKNYNQPIIFLAETQGRRETLLELLARAEIKPKVVDNLQQALKSDAKISLCVCNLEHGFETKQAVLISENDLLGERIKQTRRRQKGQAIDNDAIFKNLAELSPGQAVVHIEHGIGRYQGLQSIENAGITTEYLVLSYANDAKLYVPVSSLHLISRYTGSQSEHTPLHKLGNESWSKAKQKAAEKIKDVAAELLDVYAKREASQGFSYKINQADYQIFANSFGFEETLDQEQAIAAVLNDMQSNKAMDRLVCGDVGFGKTEVAMRAAFVAAMAGKQVAVLVPTTLLAQQHYENFRDRFANWPVNIEVLSRFKTAKEQKHIIEQVADGKIDILIGTHKLLQNDIKYHDLGLLIVDEEHRFGVKQKERIKQLRAHVDILTLTATPIPRTLNMAMGGMRELSIIATPPAKRLAVKTFVRERDDKLIREAILREILRGGQVYFLHNNVDTIEKTALDIEQLVPEAKVTIAHGQMRERELERIMSDFYHQRFNVLVCTTIVETGIDVPTANTIIMDRADHLGLAQLHQLRGRVGRSHHQAYAYLLTPHEKRMTKDAKKRLEAIASLEDLGAGFTLATHDLEIRGAGELLGEEQSGQMSQIGFSLYMEMLDHAVKSLKMGKSPDLTSLTSEQTEVELRIPALLPDDYIFDVSLRLSLYKRIASANNNAELDDIQIELIDRFGLLPQATKNLIHIAKLKLKLHELGIKKLDAHDLGGSIEFSEQTQIAPEQIIKLLQSYPKQFKMEGAQKLKFSLPSEGEQQRFTLIESILNQLQGK